MLPGARTISAARRCQLVPYRPARGQARCCPGQTPHHVVEAASFLEPGTRKKGGVLKNGGWKYDLKKAPCVCAEGMNNTTATHGLMHTFQGVRAKKLTEKTGGKWTMNQAAETGAASVNMVFGSGCSQTCLEHQIKAYHEQAGIKPEDEIDATPSGKTESEDAARAWQSYDDRATVLTQKTSQNSASR